LTSLVMGTIHGGIAHKQYRARDPLGFEVRSEALETLQQIREQIDDIVEELSAQTGKRITLDILAQRAPGGMDIAHPLVRSGRAILQALGLQPMLLSDYVPDGGHAGCADPCVDVGDQPRRTPPRTRRN
jgi:acetylornithine deacetylase/succinyl-diaminopimelate desuccinylase-like protein